jgi:hypothetical protein
MAVVTVSESSGQPNPSSKIKLNYRGDQRGAAIRKKGEEHAHEPCLVGGVCCLRRLRLYYLG